MHNKSRRLRRLHGINPNCYWCGATTIVYSQEFLLKNPQPADMASLDRVISRNHPLRKEGRLTDSGTVLCCYRCNNRRGHLEQRLGVAVTDEIFTAKRKRALRLLGLRRKEEVV